ncbi:hypothetical protein Taro_011246 [Colocasia esculenta]|uniref:Senescence domain-containing protein n=1 Tax=Colocasia esculenta TaxID=4460 RepID=A0A843UC20_COLES|nr:hypothetical protein [Colocasia esculenta]
MGCCKPRTDSPPPRTRGIVKANHREEAILQVPGASVHLMEGDEAVELAVGDVVVVGILEEGVLLATIARVGPDLQWPLTKDEPVVKLDELHYLFSLPEKDGSFLNYGVSFAGPADGRLASLDSFLRDNTCFTVSSSSSSSSSALGKGAADSGGAYWGSLAPTVEGYNGVLAKAIAGGTGVIVEGIFKCSDIYASQVSENSLG